MKEQQCISMHRDASIVTFSMIAQLISGVLDEIETCTQRVSPAARLVEVPRPNGDVGRRQVPRGAHGLTCAPN
jgi:hypothetical protein